VPRVIVNVYPRSHWSRPDLPNSGCCVPAYLCAGLHIANDCGDRPFSLVVRTRKRADRRLSVCSSPVALPVLFRLWRGKGTASQVDLAAQMLTTLTGAFGGRIIHGVGDAAFHGTPLICENSTWTTRLPANAVLFGPAPARTGKRGRPRRKGTRLGTPAQIAGGAHWQTVTVNIYGQARAVQAAVTEALRHGSFKDAPGQAVLVREPGSSQPYDLALFTLDVAATVVERYSWRWPIEPSNATGKQILGVGQACNRLEAAVERTVPFGFLVQSLLICWYVRSGYDPADICRRLLCPWYRTKHEPSAADMLAKLRREFLKARFPPSDQATAHTIKSRTTPGPGTSPPQNRETREVRRRTQRRSHGVEPPGQVAFGRRQERLLLISLPALRERGDVAHRLNCHPGGSVTRAGSVICSGVMASRSRSRARRTRLMRFER